ncbi:hypothetical protein ACFQ3P_41500 [Paraburkholderia sabiae]|uniref:Uncharacterized protein n=1 Tax=Paraburkholderia sabiae TaxID=273251 RepID=A0ABU9QRH2_9BURK|nr:hypothetical protein [Paraburkholderia sabiae]WJZ79322.1 hypothetical protein QEN71_41570 [Paraburkholderia sabiae]CAD6563049.1 hypothetical protein LMG24235_08291 [Paraburkholderia sabiae]
MSKAPPGIARFDSAAGMAQALAATLHGEPFVSPSQSQWQDGLMTTVNWLPRRTRERCYTIGGMLEGISARQARTLNIECIAEWLAGLYPQRQYDAAMIGSSNGALVHLAAAMRIPWLPQTFLCPVRAPFSDPDDASRGFDEGRPIIDGFLAADERIAVHQMQDPNQDRLMLHSMRYFRLKLLSLTLAYREFLLRNLRPGGTLYVNVCTRSWPVTRIGPRAVYQFGATGGATEDEYLRGGPSVRAYLARYGIARTRWDPPEPNDIAPEAEWGFEETLTRDLESLAVQMQWRIVELRYTEPECLSFVTAAVYRDWYRDAGIIARRLVVDSFLLMEPLTTMRLHALPFWLLFCVEPSARALERYLQMQQHAFDEIDLMLFSHGVESIGLAPIAHWRALLDKAQRAGRFVGVDITRYPRDFATFARFGRELTRREPQFAIPPPLTCARLETLLRQHGAAWQVSCTEHVPTQGATA